MSNNGNKKTHYVKIYYKDRNDKIIDTIMPIEDDNYESSLSYKENISNIATRILAEDFAFAVGQSIIPSHRIVEIACYENAPQNNSNNQNNNGNNERNKHEFNNVMLKRRFIKNGHFEGTKNNDNKLVNNDTSLASRTCLTCGKQTCDRQPEDSDPKNCKDWKSIDDKKEIVTVSNVSNEVKTQVVMPLSNVNSNNISANYIVPNDNKTV